MFERRLKVFLGVLVVFVLVLLARAAQIQIVQRDQWDQVAAKSAQTRTYIETSRGKIIDCKGVVLAEDEPCIDVCMDYRLIVDPPDKEWVAATARARIKEHSSAEFRKADSTHRQAMIDAESAEVVAQIQEMWKRLAALSGKKPEELDEVRQSIQDRMAARRRATMSFRAARAQEARTPDAEEPWYRRWLMADPSDAPEVEQKDEPLAEETQPQVIIQAIDKITTPDGESLQNELQKHLADYPGLSLQPSTHRLYPMANAACHVIGHVGSVRKEDLTDENSFSPDNLRGYRRTGDEVGRYGLEALGEPTLRGTRGMNTLDAGGQVVDTVAPRAGEDFHTTLDVQLQLEIQQMFTRVPIPWGATPSTPPKGYDIIAMHGAAVVIHIPTGDVKALVSAPDFDLNQLDQLYSSLATDNLNAPLLNRATQALREPGSTIKPVVGTGAITQGVLGVTEGIECTGYLIIDGKRQSFNKCWTARLGVAGFSHHPFPPSAPHRGHDGNPDGFLTFSDALERSCNVFFETTANRLGLDGLSYWMNQYGLGRPTGIGIAEIRGRLPNSYPIPAGRRMVSTWTAGIGQGPVGATPLQMCNVAATVARRGIWLRPNLAQAGQEVAPYKPAGVTDEDSVWNNIPSRMDLHIAPVAADAAIDGMKRVVNCVGGTGTSAFRDDMVVAGKTGTVQAASFRIPGVDENGQKKLIPLATSTHDHPNPIALWYRASDDEGEQLNHAWFTGFVPADHPQYAISVMVEYGGAGGGAVAGPIGKQIIEALVEHGYLQKDHIVNVKQPG